MSYLKIIWDITLATLIMTLCAVTLHYTDSFFFFKLIIYGLLSIIYSYVMVKNITKAILKAKQDFYKHSQKG